MEIEKSINGELYSWSNIRVNFLGRNLVGIKGIEYKSGSEIKGVKGRGSKDIGFVRGNYQASGKLMVEMSEMEAINDSLPRGVDISQIAPFPITVVYKNESQRLVTHVLKNCMFQEQNRSGKAGEVKEFEVELPLYIGEIDWNA